LGHLGGIWRLLGVGISSLILRASPRELVLLGGGLKAAASHHFLAGPSGVKCEEAGCCLKAARASRSGAVPWAMGRPLGAGGTSPSIGGMMVALVPDSIPVPSRIPSRTEAPIMLPTAKRRWPSSSEGHWPNQ